MIHIYNNLILMDNSIYLTLIDITQKNVLLSSGLQ